MALYAAEAGGMQENLQGMEQHMRAVLLLGLLLLLTAGALISIGLHRYRVDKLLHKKQLRRSRLEQLFLQAQLELQHDALKNIWQEIHDNIGQVLSLAKLQLGTIDIKQMDALQEKTRDARQLVSRAITDLRLLSHTPDAGQLSQLGLLRALEAELQQAKKAGAHQTFFKIAGTPYRLDSQKELILFCIAREAIRNIVRHAGAGTITVSAGFSPGELKLFILDDGKGFTNTLHNTNENTTFGLGIRNMHSRANLIGATFSINSTPGSGTTVSISLSLTIKPN